jgi:hypothetical protein
MHSNEECQRCNMQQCQNMNARVIASTATGNISMVQLMMRRILSPACSPTAALEVILQLLLSRCAILLDDAGVSAVVARLSAGS